ncbi:MAG: SMP-30/gluconolactonase/LRE family protein [Betaproteobacteria bacterium]|nr:SMP-30/gluconolactonase/LRE family protein [Betaproteobacteria bacterium]
MNHTTYKVVAVLFAAACLSAHADDVRQTTSFSTLITTPFVAEGLTNDNNGNLYQPGRATAAGAPCPIWQIPVAAPVLTVVGFIPAPTATGNCSPSGLALGPDGQMYVTETDRIYRFTPSASSPPTGTLFASNMPGTNDIAFDRYGNLWTGDGTTGLGRVWKISTAGTVTEMFRIPPMANDVNAVAGVGGVGRDVRSLPTGAITITATSRNAQNLLGSQPLVVNGLAFTRRGNLFLVDTARGAIWLVRMDSSGNPLMKAGCDSTFPANTLCMDHIWVQNPLFEGADGLVLDEAGNIWVDANERNAVVVMSYWGEVVEVFRNLPDATTKLRNTGPLETPASPIIIGHKFCTSNSDGNRRDNSPNTAGEIGGTGAPKGKISCLNQSTGSAGLQLPVR